MRLGRRLSLCLLGLGMLTPGPVYSAQLPLSSHPTPESTTLVTALNADPDYTCLIKLLQRARLIPTLNKLNGSTLFAPTNDAIRRRHPAFCPPSGDALPETLDNVNERLRQELFYHLLNYTIVAFPSGQDPEVHKTLHFPHQPIEQPSPEPPPSPPWMPIENGTLGTEPQRLRVASREERIWVGVNAAGEGGVRVVKGQVNVDNGIVLGIDDILQVPPDLATVVSQLPPVRYFQRIMDAELQSTLNNTEEMTLFLPVDSAWDALEPYERLYLESDFATDDLYRILHSHAVKKQGVKWSESFNPGLNLTTISGDSLEVVWSPEKILVSSAELVERDIYASNGVIHTVSSLLIPPGALELTPEKYLLTLNCTSFVSLIHSVNLTSLINDASAEYTILAPQDDVLKIFANDEQLPEPGSEELKRLLQYHFLPGKWSPEALSDGMLLQTALEEPGLNFSRQVLPVDVTDEDRKRKDPKRTVRFGGAGVVGDPVQVNNTLFYFMSRPLLPPADALQTALPNLDLSTFLAATFSANLSDTLKTHPSTTLLVPHNDAFKRIGGLVSEYLLASSQEDLKRVILHHTLDGVAYAADLVNGTSRSYPTLEGSDVTVSRSTEDVTTIAGSGGWSGMQAVLTPHNLLTKTGAVHEVSDVLLPRSVDLTIGKLVKAAKGSIMTTMISKASMEWVLNGTLPHHHSNSSRGSDDEYTLPKGSTWTLLCPTDDSFKNVNLTALYADVPRLRDIIAQHIIPSPPSSASAPPPVLDGLVSSRPLPIADSATYASLRSPTSVYGDLVFREDGDNSAVFIVGIKGARGTASDEDWARVLSWGRATSPHSKGGVIQIDRLLLPYAPPWYLEYGAPVTVGAVGVIIIAGFFWGVRKLWRKDFTEATYEPIGGFNAQTDEDE